MIMARVATSSMFFHEYQVDEVFQYAAAAGCSGIEFWLETPDFWLRGLPETELLALVRQYPSLSPITVHAPILDLNPCSINPDVAAVSRDFTVRAVEIAERAGASVVTVHPGRRTAKRPPSKADYERFERLIALLRECGERKHVAIAIENMPPAVNAILSTPEGVRELLDREPHLSFTLDTAHALAASRSVVGEYLELCGDRLVNVHLSWMDGSVQHLPLHGDPGAAALVEEIAASGYDGPLTLEIEDLNFAYAYSAEEKCVLLGRELAWVAEHFS
jgi:sugar phosphate isomerase/epimerase